MTTAPTYEFSLSGDFAQKIFDVLMEKPAREVLPILDTLRQQAMQQDRERADAAALAARQEQQRAAAVPPPVPAPEVAEGLAQ